jgi:adenine phosphoribosyltransferase
MVKEITIEQVKEKIRTIPDFPKPGIQFRDITTVLKQPELFTFVVDSMADSLLNRGITKVVCIEARGFMLGGAIAYKLGAGFIPIRKPGKLPARTYSKKYTLEYGSDAMEMHSDALTKEDVVLLHDDLLATGGTAKSATELIRVARPKEIILSFFCELGFLNGRNLLTGYEVNCLINL